MKAPSSVRYLNQNRRNKATVVTLLGKMLSIVPGEPPGAPSTKSMFSGRKQHTKSKSQGAINTSLATHGKNASSNKSKSGDEKTVSHKKKNNTSLDELDRMLENDAFALMGMQKELELSQQAEVEKSNNLLKDLKKEFDTLKIDNELKEKILLSNQDAYRTLCGVIHAGNSTSSGAQEVIKDLNSQLEVASENLHAEQNTNASLSLITNRLESEISKCQLEIHQTNFSLDHVKHDLKAKEVTLRISKQEYAEQQKQFDTLMKALKSRRGERKSKLNQLQSIILNGETSVARIQNSMMEASQVNITL